MFKEKLEGTQPIDVIGIGHMNAEMNDDDEMGLYDHIYDSTSQENDGKNEALSHISEAKNENSEAEKVIKRKIIKRNATKLDTSKSNLKKTKVVPEIKIERMSTERFNSSKGIKSLEYTKKSAKNILKK